MKKNYQEVVEESKVDESKTRELNDMLANIGFFSPPPPLKKHVTKDLLVRAKEGVFFTDHSNKSFIDASDSDTKISGDTAVESCFTKDGEYVLAASRSSLKFYEVSTGVAKDIPYKHQIVKMELSRGGVYVQLLLRESLAVFHVVLVRVAL